MKVTLTASLVAPEDNKIVYLEREVEFPFVPEPGLMLNGLHPDEDGWSLKIEVCCWDHKAQTLNADVNPVCVDMGASLDEESHKWVEAGWKVTEIADLYLTDERDEDDLDDADMAYVEGYQDGHEDAKGGDLDGDVSDGGAIVITDSVVNIYNGGTADVHQTAETAEDE